MDQAMAKHWGYNVNKTQSKGLNDAKDISERPHLTHRTPTQGCGHTTATSDGGPGKPSRRHQNESQTRFSEMQVSR